MGVSKYDFVIVVKVGMVTAAGSILRVWRREYIPPDYKRCLETMTELTSCKQMLAEANNDGDEERGPWFLHCKHVRTI